MSDSRPSEGPLQRAEIVDFYEHASPDLHRLLSRRLGNAEDAREVAHDAFEKLLRQAEREDIRDLRRFFFTMANRMALDVLRRREVRRRFCASTRSMPAKRRKRQGTRSGSCWGASGSWPCSGHWRPCP